MTKRLEDMYTVHCPSHEGFGVGGGEAGMETSVVSTPLAHQVGFSTVDAKSGNSGIKCILNMTNIRDLFQLLPL